MAAAKKSFELDVVEVLWINTALKTQISVLRRKRSTEVVGSEIYTLRGKELEVLENLVSKF